jgi:hypothetical protein
MFRPLESKFVNFTRFPAIFDVYKPYDAIYKRAFVGAFLSDVNKNSYCRLVRHPACTITPKGRMVDEACVRNTQGIVC